MMINGKYIIQIQSAWAEKSECRVDETQERTDRKSEEPAGKAVRCCYYNRWVH